MADPTTIKGGKIEILLGDSGTPIVYAAPCGFSARSASFSKELSEISIPNCDDPDEVDWIGRDAKSLSMSLSGQGVLASESVETWLDAWDSVEPVPVKMRWIFPAKTITWTGKMHVETLAVDGNNGERATLNTSLQSDGTMTRVVS